jgi:hypothetical protein
MLTRAFDKSNLSQKMFIRGTSSSQRVDKMLMSKFVLGAPARQQAMETLKQCKELL